jgi:hypothetical protein
VFAVVGPEWGMVPHLVPRWSSLVLPKTTFFNIAQSKIWGALCQQEEVRSFFLIFEPTARNPGGCRRSRLAFFRPVPCRHGTAAKDFVCSARPAAGAPILTTTTAGKLLGIVRCVCEGGVVMSKKAHKQVGSLVWDRVGDRQLTAHTPCSPARGLRHEDVRDSDRRIGTSPALGVAANPGP